MSPQDFLLLHSALERTVALTMNVTLASIVIKSFVFTSDVIVEAEYYVTVGNGNVSSLVSSLLKSVTTGLFTTYFVGFSGIKSADCSIIPITRVIDASPTSVPTMTPALIPSAMPTQGEKKGGLQNNPAQPLCTVCGKFSHDSKACPAKGSH